MVVEKVVYIQNKLGMHLRPATLLVREASRFKSKIELEVDGTRVNGKSFMGVMMLAAAYGSKVTINATGEDAEEAVEKIKAIIDSKFDEE
ncbi:MAG: HPr family phosphocarrier protein [Candidatus Latescibacter sp.]|nr:HPr family phosphocarrier protein [Candidatus Latescibacter sp.]